MRAQTDQRQSLPNILRAITVLVLVAGLVLLFTSFWSADPPAQAQSITSRTQVQSSRQAVEQSQVGVKCVSCHRPYVNSFLMETHGKTAKFLNDSRATMCESCHGNGERHIENREKRIAADDIDNPTQLKTPEERRRANAACLQCHSGDRNRFSWQASEHDRSDMSCMSCHNVHHAKFAQWAMASRERAKVEGPITDSEEIKFPDKMLATFSVEETCLRCHTEQRKALFQRSTHLFRTELRNMKVDCTSCHNTHDGDGGKMLLEPTVNNLCYTCHAEKRGPFLWDHPPVREDCRNCHSPH